MDRFTGRLAEPFTYAIAAALFFTGCFFYASFLAWNEERDEVEKLKREGLANKPLLKGLFVGPFEFQDVAYEKDFYGTEIRIRFDVRNLGSPSAVTSWRLYLERPDSLPEQFGEMRTYPGFADLQHTGSTAEAVSQSPVIPRGGNYTWHLRFHASKEQRDLIGGGGRTWRLVYTDITGREYTNTCRS